MPVNSNIQKIERLTRFMLMILAGLLVVLLALIVTFFATKPSNKPAKPPKDSESVTDSQSASDTATDPVILTETSDAGMTYQDKIIFVGDSLTAHLINRGVLTGGTNTKQVWRCENNMMNLNSEVTAAKIIYPETGEKMTVAQAAAKAKPEIMIITLGTDWGVSYLSEEEFKSCYTDLIKGIQAASPNTKIILQSIFPVTQSCTTLDNAKIDTANKWVKAIAAESGCRYLDTQTVLKDDKNCLKAEYCNSNDGIHMGKNAYEVILQYIRTHALAD